MSIRLIIDSASDINKEEADELKVIMLPMEVQIGNQIYLDGVDLTPQQFYEKLIESDDLPKTTQINPYRFIDAYKKVIDNGDEAIVITISSKLSGSYRNAVLGAKELNAYENKIYVIDSLNASIGERLLIQYALKLINEKKNIKDIVSELNKKKTDIKFLAMLDTLKYLKKGGRISSIVAFSGELLSIKPVISIVNGEVKLVGKARGSKNGKNLLNKLLEDCGGINFDMPYGVIYSGTSDYTIKKYLLDSQHFYQDKVDFIPIYVLGCTIGTHIGPGGIGVAFFANSK